MEKWKRFLPLHVLLYTIEMLTINMGQTMDRKLHTPCPTMCTCKKQIVACVNNGYTYIPALPHNTTSLTFIGNTIPLLDASSLANLTNQRIKKINLNNNSIEYVHSDSFTKLRFVSHLELQFNTITRIPKFCGDNGIDNLPNMTYIQLSHNILTSIKKGDFDGGCLPNVSLIDLSFNMIKQVPNNIFSTLPLLRKLLLSSVNFDHPAHATFPLFAPLAFNISSLRLLDI